MLALVSALVPVAQPAKGTPRVANGVYIFRTNFSTNLGLGYCTPASDRGCVESISVGGVTLQQVGTPTAASYFVGGGVYRLPCRFVATSSTSYEAPHLSITRLDGAALTDVDTDNCGRIWIVDYRPRRLISLRRITLLQR